MHRCARSATSRACVTTTIVLPSLFSSSNSDSTEFRGLAVKRAGRLVGQDQDRIVDQRAGDGDALLLSAGELARPVLRAMGQAHAIKRRMGPTLPFGISDVRVGQRHFHVLKGAAAGEERGRLEHEAYFPIPDRRASIFPELGNLTTV